MAIPPDLIQAIADTALRVSIRKSGIVWPDGQAEECYQEACVAILEAERFKPGASREYLYASALHGIVGVQRRLYRKRIEYVHGVDLDLMIAPPAKDTLWLMRRLPEIAGLLRRQRKWITSSTDLEVKRELFFLKLRLEGYQYHEIDTRMGYMPGGAQMMGMRLQTRLGRIAAGILDVEPRRPGPKPTAASTAAMIAASRTPEARAKHADALRVSCNTPEGRARMAAAARARWARR